MIGDGVGIVEDDVLGGLQDARPGGLGGVAHGAARLHRQAGLLETGGGQKGLGRTRRHLLGAGDDARRAGEPGDDDEQHDGGEPRPVRIALAGVAGVEIVPDDHPDEEDQRGDQPVPLRGERQRIVGRQHEEDHWQGEVIIVQGALLGDLAISGVGHAAGLEIGDDDLLVGDDHHGHVCRHDGGGEGPHMQHGGAAGEQLGIAPAHGHKDGKQHQHQPGGGMADGGFAQGVVEHPAQYDGADREADGLPLGQVEHVAIDEVEIGADVIDQGHQHEAGDPGPVAFPFEPGEVFGQEFGRHQIFLDVIKAAAMDLPLLAMGERGQARGLAQAQIERDKIEG